MTIKELETLFNFATEFNKFENPRDIFKGIESMLSELGVTEKVLVVSFPAKSQTFLRELQSNRVVLNRDNRDFFNSYNEELNDRIAAVFNEGNNGTSFQTKDGKHIYVLNMGCCDGHDFCFFFMCEDKVADDFNSHLVKLGQSLLNRVKSSRDYKKLEGLIFVDDVTGLYNQRKLHMDLKNLVSRYEDESEEFVALFVDIDHFKQVNDGHGHIIGTELLTKVGKVILDTVRDTDLCYRYGGDEFVILAPNTLASDGFRMGERLLSSIKSAEFAVQGTEKEQQMKLSVSIGVASFPKHAKTGEEIINIADQMMYHAKKSGRGTVKTADEMVEIPKP
jgi:diguanylate cyclase (GGDEF)-like protein